MFNLLSGIIRSSPYYVDVIITVPFVIIMAAVVVRYLVSHRREKNHPKLKRVSKVTENKLTEFIVHRMIGLFLGASRGAVSETTETKPCIKIDPSFHNIYQLVDNNKSDSNQRTKPKRRVVFANQANGKVVEQRFYYDPWIGSPCEDSRPSTGHNIFGSPVFDALPRTSLADRQKTPPPRRARKLTSNNPNALLTSTFKLEKENTHFLTSNQSSKLVTGAAPHNTTKHAPPVKADSTSPAHMISTQLFPAVEPPIQFRERNTLESASGTSLARCDQASRMRYGRIPLRSSGSIKVELLTKRAKALREERIAKSFHSMNRLPQNDIPLSLTNPLLTTSAAVSPTYQPTGISRTTFVVNAVHDNLTAPQSMNKEPTSTADSPPFTPVNTTQPDVTASFRNASPLGLTNVVATVSPAN